MTTLRIGQTWDGVPVGDDEAVALTLSLDGDALVVDVDAPYHGDPPPDGPPGPRWGLWEHEAVELFVAGPDACASPPAYTEIELGPHGHHLVLQLVGVRSPVAKELPIELVAKVLDGRWTARARVPLALLPVGAPESDAPLAGAAWSINATAVHGPPDARRYLTWAPLGGPKPDFHQLARFRPVPS